MSKIPKYLSPSILVDSFGNAKATPEKKFINYYMRDKVNHMMIDALILNDMDRIKLLVGPMFLLNLGANIKKEEFGLKNCYMLSENPSLIEIMCLSSSTATIKEVLKLSYIRLENNFKDKPIISKLIVDLERYDLLPILSKYNLLEPDTIIKLCIQKYNADFVRQLVSKKQIVKRMGSLVNNEIEVSMLNFLLKLNGDTLKIKNAQIPDSLDYDLKSNLNTNIIDEKNKYSNFMNLIIPTFGLSYSKCSFLKLIINSHTKASNQINEKTCIKKEYIKYFDGTIAKVIKNQDSSFEFLSVMLKHKIITIDELKSTIPDIMKRNYLSHIKEANSLPNTPIYQYFNLNEELLTKLEKEYLANALNINNNKNLALLKI